MVAKFLRVECISNHAQTPEQKLIIAMWKMRKQFHGRSRKFYKIGCLTAKMIEQN